MTNRRFGSRSLANLRGVHPDLVRVIARALVDGPLDFTVVEGLRSVAQQRINVQKGVSKTMNSRHIHGLAVDLLPINPQTGKGSYDWVLYHILGPAVKAAATKENVALTWGADWTTFKDGPHFELPHALYPNGIPIGSSDPAQLVANLYATTPKEA